MDPRTADQNGKYRGEDQGRWISNGHSETSRVVVEYQENGLFVSMWTGPTSLLPARLEPLDLLLETNGSFQGHLNYFEKKIVFRSRLIFYEFS